MQNSESSETRPEAGAAGLGASHPTGHQGGWQTDRLILAGLLVLSLVGLAIADFSATLGLSYWLYAVPIFAAASIYSGWARARHQGQSVLRILRRQVLHWAPLPAALFVVYRLERAGRLNLEDAGLVALLSLALTTILAGVHFDWRLGVVGLLLGAATVCAALVEEFFWVLLLPALLVGGFVLFWQRRASANAARGGPAGSETR